MAIANVPHGFQADPSDHVAITNEYNAAFPELLKSISTEQSPLAVVHFNENYDCSPEACDDGTDSVHPNAMGEYHIAQAFVKTLLEIFSFQGTPFVVPNTIPARVCDTPRHVVAISSANGGTTLTWDVVDGAYGYYIWGGVDDSAEKIDDYVGTKFEAPGTGAGGEYRIQAHCANTLSELSAPGRSRPSPFLRPRR
jgi:hypothetical protein